MTHYTRSYQQIEDGFCSEILVLQNHFELSGTLLVIAKFGPVMFK